MTTNTTNFYTQLSEAALSEKLSEDADYEAILTDAHLDRLLLLQAAYQVRYKHYANTVSIHILNNAQNGYCPEDCSYCAQSKVSDAPIEKYPRKEKESLMAEAKSAYANGAHRYCMVFSGRGPSPKRIETLCDTIRSIKAEVPVEICLSAGLIDDNAAQKLKNAGLDRLNHNLNTSKENYPSICSTHTYQDRLDTLYAAKNAALSTCSGVIIGMGEKTADIVQLAKTFRHLETASIPINFLMPMEGAPYPKHYKKLTPGYCLRVLCLFRFINPKAEIRVAAGREYHLRSLEAFSLYPANSLFLDGYLNAKGAEQLKTLQMIKDLGFDIQSDQNLDELLEESVTPTIELKSDTDLHPVEL